MNTAGCSAWLASSSTSRNASSYEEALLREEAMRYVVKEDLEAKSLADFASHSCKLLTTTYSCSSPSRSPSAVPTLTAGSSLGPSQHPTCRLSWVHFVRSCGGGRPIDCSRIQNLDD